MTPFSGLPSDGKYEVRQKNNNNNNTVERISQNCDQGKKHYANSNTICSINSWL
jgi:hypothetical protein